MSKTNKVHIPPEEQMQLVTEARSRAGRLNEFVAGHPKDATGAHVPIQGHKYNQFERSALAQDQGVLKLDGTRVPFLPQDKANNETAIEHSSRLGEWYRSAGLSYNTRDPLNDPEFRLGKK